MKTSNCILVGFLLFLLSGCSIAPIPRSSNLSVLADDYRIDTEFTLKKGFWVYTYPEPIGIFDENGREVWYRMTAATGGVVGGRRLADYYREYWGILHVGTQLRLVGVTQYKDGMAYIAEVINPDRKELENELIEIYDELDNYSEQTHPTGCSQAK